MNASDADRDSNGMAAAQSLALTPADIHLWLAFYDQVDAESMHAAYWALLNDAEKAQQARFHFARDRHRFLVTRALVRTVLSRYAPIHPRDWIFSTNAYGRPDVANVQASDAGLSFNISHTHSLIVLGVTRQRALGVDVENFTAREVSIDIANHYFAAPEVAALGTVPLHRQQYRFFEYWTFKESYIKARGMGLSLPLDKFSFHYAHDQAVDITIHPELADDAARWQFWQFCPTQQYMVAVCAERVGAESSKLTVRQAVPLRDETLLSPTFLRTSA